MDLKRWFGFVVACVAAITLTVACSSNDTDQSQSPNSPQAKELEELEMPPDYDELDNWSSGATTPEFENAADKLGLAQLTIPRPDMMGKGYVGVAPVGERCIVALSPEGSDKSKGNLSVVILSRFDFSLNVIATNQSTQGIRAFVDRYRGECGYGTPT